MEFSQRLRWLVVEFFIIVLGVLSAFFVDTWIDDRADSKRTEIYRERLVADLETDVINIEAAISYYHRIRDYGLKTLDDLEGTAPLDDFILLFSAFNAAEEWGFRLEDATYLDMQSTGGLALFDDVQLRLELADYHRQAITRSVVWNLPRAYRIAARGIIPNALQTAIHEQCSAIPDDIVNGVAGLRGITGSKKAEPLSAAVDEGYYCGIDSDRFKTAGAAAELRSLPEVTRQLRFRVSEIRISINMFEAQGAMAEALLDELNKMP